ncbi:MAG: DUF2779 domain-containing protein [Candidatus Saccharimonadales bacterium]
MMPTYLSKSNFMHWLIHPAYLWLEKHEKKRLPPITQADEFMFSKGHDFEAEARKLFPEGKLVDAKPWEFAQLKAQTVALMEAREETIFQATAFTERGLLVKSDILKRRGEVWDLYEVKSSTRVKDDHLTDLAFQAVTWAEAGITIEEVYVLYVDREYARGEKLEPERLVRQECVSEAVMARIPGVERQIPAALATLERNSCPDLDPSHAGNLGVWLPLYFHLNPELAADHPLRLAQLKPEDLARLQQLGVESLTEIERYDGFNARQQSQIKAWQMESSINHSEIANFLNKLEFPLWFLDYETISHAVPLYPGTKPYQDVPFQYSLHKLDSPTAELKHFEYLSTSTEFPVPKLLEQLQQDLDGLGSILVWYQNFEKGMNARMGEFCPEYSEWLAAVNGRIRDLMIPFSSGWYVDKRFVGSASIKNVLPVLAPKLSYKTLNVQDGGSAQAVWYDAVFNDRGSAKTYDNLLQYCALDTLAMVEIYNFLIRLSRDDERPATGQLEQAQLF